MADIDLLGPGDAGAARALPSTDPTVTAAIGHPDALDTYFGDCVSNIAGTGTPIVSVFLNRLLQQSRRLIRLTGVPLSNANDDMMGLAIQSGSLNWVGAYGGTANALIATLSPVPSLLLPGLRVAGMMGAANNTGPTTLTVGGVTLPATLADGTPMAGGELTANEFVLFTAVGAGGSVSSWAMTSPLPLSFFGSRYVPLVPATTFYVNNLAGSDSSGNGLTAGTAWFSIANALTQVSKYNLGGQTITLQLALTGVTYANPPKFATPSSGTLAIQGNPAAQSSYTIGGNPASVGATGVINVNGGTVSLIGLTLADSASGTTGNAVCAAAVLNVQNVTFAGANTIGYHLVGSTSSTVNIFAGCLWAQSGQSAIFTQNGGNANLYGNVATSGSPAWSAACCVAVNDATFAMGGVGGWTFTGSATGPRYSAATGGVINTSGGGASFFPGSTAGSSTTGYYA